MPIKDLFDTGNDDNDDSYIGRECYVFNTSLSVEDDDTACNHCAKFMTIQCQYIGEFIDED